jgi:hypothetical protein
MYGAAGGGRRQTGRIGVGVTPRKVFAIVTIVEAGQVYALGAYGRRSQLHGFGLKVQA